MYRGFAYSFLFVDTGLLFLVGEFDDENTVLRHKADEHDDTDLAENIHRLVVEIHEDECPAYSQRYGEHDDEGVFEALELGGQDEIDEYQCEDKGKHQARRTFSIFFRISGKGSPESVIECFFGDFIHLIETLSYGFSLGQTCGNGCRYETVIPIELGRSCTFDKSNEVVELYHVAVAVTYVYRFQIDRFVPLLAVYLS